MSTGKVKFYNPAKGFGFIVDKETNDEIFVHATGIVEGTIKEGDEVTFEITQGKKGLNAVNVELV
ncbi:MAG: cold shock domain-containing protein [Nanoarchaeota archaeon]